MRWPALRFARVRGLSAHRQNELPPVTVIPEFVRFRHAPQDGALDNAVARPPASRPGGEGERFTPKPTMQVVQPNALVEAIVERLPTTCRTILPSALPSARFAPSPRWKPRTPRTVVRDYGTQDAFPPPNPREMTVDDLEGSLGFGVAGPRTVVPDLPAPSGIVTGEFTLRIDRHGLALEKLCAIAFLLRDDPNLAREDVPPAAGQRRVRRPGEPDPRRDGQGIQNRRFSGPVVANQQGKPRVQLQTLLIEALEVPYADAIDSHEAALGQLIRRPPNLANRRNDS